MLAAGPLGDWSAYRKLRSLTLSGALLTGPLSAAEQLPASLRLLDLSFNGLTGGLAGHLWPLRHATLV